MKWGRIVFGAIAVTVFGAIYTMLTCGGIFKWVYALPPIEVWKPEAAMTGSFWGIALAGHFILSLIFAAVFGWLYKALPSKCSCCRGFSYGLIVWLVGMLPGMFATYMFMTVAPIVVIYWTISGLVNLLISGLIVALIYGSEGETAGSCCCH